MNKHILEKLQIASAIVPVNLAAGANAGDWVSLKNFGRCAIVVFAGVGAAAQDPTLTLEQATNVAGSGTVKALNFTRIDVMQRTALTAGGTFETVTQAAGNTYTEATAGEEQMVWVVDIKAEDLDVDGGYDCVRASIGDTGSTSKVGCALYLLHEPRFSPAGGVDPLTD